MGYTGLNLHRAPHLVVALPAAVLLPFAATQVEVQVDGGEEVGVRGVVAQVECERRILKPGLICKGKGLKPGGFKL
jgi:hypothetical protein